MGRPLRNIHTQRTGVEWIKNECRWPRDITSCQRQRRSRGVENRCCRARSSSVRTRVVASMCSSLAAPRDREWILPHQFPPLACSAWRCPAGDLTPGGLSGACRGLFCAAKRPCQTRLGVSYPSLRGVKLPSILSVAVTCHLSFATVCGFVLIDCSWSIGDCHLTVSCEFKPVSSLSVCSRLLTKVPGRQWTPWATCEFMRMC